MRFGFWGALLFLIAVLGWPAGGAWADRKPEFPDDLVITGPGGVEFVFRPVSLGVGGGPLASRRFNLGDPGQGFRAWPTAVALGGSFVRPGQNDPDQEEWIYYLGKYELTEEQYYAVMGPPKGAGPEKLRSRKPMTGLSCQEARTFLDTLNQWLFANNLAQLPLFNDIPGHLRLPTEAEWEFAARGGTAVAADVFSGRHPYAGALAAHEWFSGPKSSHDKVQEVGKLQPNPLGLYDMLGNVSEMTATLYQLEYYQGRVGGLAARGGHFLTKEKDLGAALRTEEPFYLGNRQTGLKPNRKPTMGLRLAIGSSILTDRTEIDTLEEAWDEYRQNAGASLPAGASTAPVGVRTDIKAGDARAYLANIKSRLATAELSPSALEAISQELGYVEAALSDIDVIRKKADDDSALSWVRMANLFSQHFGREAVKLVKLAELRKITGQSDRKSFLLELDKRQVDIEANLAEALTAYHQALTQMGALAPDSVERALAGHRDYLKNQSSPSPGAQASLELLTRHFQALKTKRVIGRDMLIRDLSSLTAF